VQAALQPTALERTEAGQRVVALDDFLVALARVRRQQREPSLSPSPREDSIPGSPADSKTVSRDGEDANNENIDVETRSCAVENPIEVDEGDGNELLPCSPSVCDLISSDSSGEGGGARTGGDNRSITVSLPNYADEDDEEVESLQQRSPRQARAAGG
jgi:hypothetical protein